MKYKDIHKWNCIESTIYLRPTFELSQLRLHNTRIGIVGRYILQAQLGCLYFLESFIVFTLYIPRSIRTLNAIFNANLWSELLNSYVGFLKKIYLILRLYCTYIPISYPGLKFSQSFQVLFWRIRNSSCFFHTPCNMSVICLGSKFS